MAWSDIEPDFSDALIERMDAQREVRRAMGHMTPAERRAMFDILADRPVRDKADQKARERARKRMKRVGKWRISEDI